MSFNLDETSESEIVLPRRIVSDRLRPAISSFGNWIIDIPPCLYTAEDGVEPMLVLLLHYFLDDSILLRNFSVHI